MKFPPTAFAASLIAASLFVTSLPQMAGAQSATTASAPAKAKKAKKPKKGKITTPEAARDLALEEDRIAYDIVEGITTEVGPRLAGTEQEARAREWAVKKMKALGFANVRIEAFDMPVWVRGKETAYVTSPFPQELKVTALGNSGSTGEDGIEAEIAYFPTFAALKAAPEGSLKGKIAFVSHKMKPSQDGSSYGSFGGVRFTGPSVAAKKGAAAIVIRSVGTDYHRNPHTGNTTFEAGITPIPSGALSIPDAENLERMIKRKKPVRMKLVLTPQQIGVRQSGNVIGEIIGTDPNAGVIAVGGHLDSWDLGTGAIDDGAGIAISAAAAKRVSMMGKPRRTIRVVWFGAEEVGIWGGKEYAKRYPGRTHAATLESDFGAGRIWRVDFKLTGTDAKLVEDRIADALSPLGIGRGREPAGGGPDMGPVVADGAPAIDLQQDGTDYFNLHHTPDDTLDKIDPAALRQNVAAWTATLAILANAPEDLLPPQPASVPLGPIKASRK
jgi:carboxypeptidase Q